MIVHREKAQSDFLGIKNENWQAAEEETAVYTMAVTPAESGNTLLGRAEVTVTAHGGAPLCVLPTAWQEVDGDA